MNIINADCLEAMRDMEDNSVTAIVTDPPYALEFMGKGWDKVLPAPAVWEEALRVLKPGGIALVFGGTRTYHRLTCSLEDAGFQIRDCMMWLYGSGFPKSLDVSKAIDKAGGSDGLHREARVSMARNIRTCRIAKGMSRKSLAALFPEYGFVTENWERVDHGFRVPSLDAYNRLVSELGVNPQWREKVRAADLRLLVSSDGTDRRGDGTVYGMGLPGKSYEHTTEAAQLWNGWGTALKPAWEPIVLAMKPLDGTFAANALAHGVAGLNVDGCRIEGPKAGGSGQPPLQFGGENSRPFHANAKPREFDQSKGRWPANLVLDEKAGALLNAQSGELKSGARSSKSKRHSEKNRHTYEKGWAGDGEQAYPSDVPASTGGASRFFYCAKASKKDRGQDNTHPTVKPLSLMRYLVRLVTMPEGTVILDPFAGSGTTGVACREEGVDCILIEQSEEYTEIINRRLS
jgi:DNA modification methylase